MSSLRRRLYRTLLQKAQHFDANPAMKGILRDLHVFGPLNLRTLYSPSMQQPFVQLVKQIFRQPPAEGINDELGFNILRHLNEVDAKFYAALYPKPAEGAPATLLSAGALAPQVHAVSSLAAQHPVKHEMAVSPDRFWAMPIPMGDENRTTAGGPGDLVPAPPCHSQKASKVTEFHPLTPGVVLANHPLVEWPFARCCMLVLETGPDYVVTLILNYPKVHHVGPRNYVFPPVLRHHQCHVGGPFLSQEMPPIPNYYILHSHPSIPNAKVLLADEERPVCISGGEDIAAIGEFLKQRKGRPEDFSVFAGCLLLPKAELQKQVQEGFWMPMLTSSEFVHSGAQLGQLFWNGLMEKCGGEFSHMPLVRSFIDGAPNAPQQ